MYFTFGAKLFCTLLCVQFFVERRCASRGPGHHGDTLCPGELGGTSRSHRWDQGAVVDGDGGDDEGDENDDEDDDDDDSDGDTLTGGVGGT